MSDNYNSEEEDSNCLRPSKKQLGSGFKQISVSSDSNGSGKFERGSSDMNDDSITNLPNIVDDNEIFADYKNCIKATIARVKPTKDFIPTGSQLYVAIEGPEYDLDYSYWVIHMNNLMAALEKGI